MLPARSSFCGAATSIPAFPSLHMATHMARARQAGSPGGTAIVTRSSALRISVPATHHRRSSMLQLQDCLVTRGHAGKISAIKQDIRQAISTSTEEQY